MEKKIPQPQNWQDFETLCKKLWSEEWKARLKKNGRNGQGQKGVDIYGLPEGLDRYFGIQCKLKGVKEIINAKEIDKEISKAEEFKPELKHLLIATTASKDSKVEEYVRTLSINRINAGNFSVEIFCWEDIESLIREHYHVYQWYMQNLSVERSYAVKISFEDKTTEATIKPKFLKYRKTYFYQPYTELELMNKQLFENLAGGIDLDVLKNLVTPFDRPRNSNETWCDLGILFENIGSASIKHWELRFFIDNDDAIFRDEAEFSYLAIPNVNSWTVTWKNEVLFRDPGRYPFVQKDHAIIEFSVKPKVNIKNFQIKWQLIAEDFNDSGTLRVIVEPEFIENETRERVLKKSEERIEEWAVSDYLKPL